MAKFKQEFARQQRDDLFDLSEKLSVKSLEAAALEQQLGSATRQLAHAQQHILRLERNPQLSSMQVNNINIELYIFAYYKFDENTFTSVW